MALRRPDWISRWSTDTAAQAGVIGAAWSVAGSLSRGLLPRSPIDQAVATGVTAAIHYELTATAWSSLEAIASIPGTHPGTTARVVVASGAIIGGYGTAFVTAKAAPHNPAAAIAYAAGRQIAFAGISGGAASLWDEVLHKRLHLRPGLDTTLVPNIITGAAIAAGNVYFSVRRAHKYGVVNPDNHRVAGANARSLTAATGIGIASFIGLGTLVVGEQVAAHGLQRLMRAVIRRDPGAAGSFIAHAALLGTMGLAGAFALKKVTDRLEHADDIIEPAYPAAPTNPQVSAGPRSDMPFASIGKEGRRFVTMSLTHDEITRVMGEPAVDPVRVVCGYETTDDLRERARLGVADLEACGGFERSLICVASPTGVGYVNYTIIEALEYLSRGNCATIVPQYALVPSALAMPKTGDGVMLTRYVLEDIQARLASIPAERRPRVVLLGESLGANVALDVSTVPGPFAGIPALEHLGVSGGVYFGVPFRTEFWRRWRDNPEAMDPEHEILLVAEPSEAPPLPPGHMRHLMVVHHDDPVNKYAYTMVLQPPWWMGPPTTRPPMVPRETRWRPITSFVIATVDLKNGMNSKPGTFIRRGHDYRIEARLGLQRSYGLACTDEQAESIEHALRDRETEWAARRMIARKMDRARRSIASTLEKWGSPQINVADIDPGALPDLTPDSPLRRLGMISGPPGV
jgi:uncharacterized membrane protein